MKNKKSKKNNKYIKLNIFFGVVIVILLGLSFYLGMNVKTETDKKYLDLSDHLLKRHVDLVYSNETGDYCEATSKGISKDGDVYVKFWCIKYDVNTQEQVSDKTYHTLYFQHPDPIKDPNGIGYAEATTDD